LYNDLWSYDLSSTATWQKLDPGGNAPDPREFFGAYPFQNGQTIVYGGYDYNYNYFNDTYALTSTQDQTYWENIPTVFPPAGRAAFAGAALNDNKTVILYGGIGHGGYDVFDDTWTFTYPQSWENWAVQGPGPRFGSASGLSNKGTGMILFGGCDDNNSVYNDLWLFTITPQSSSSGGSQSTGVTSQTANPTTGGSGQSSNPTTGGSGQSSNPTTGGAGPSTGCVTCQSGYSTGGQTTEGPGGGVTNPTTGGGQSGSVSTGQLRRNKTKPQY